MKPGKTNITKVVTTKQRGFTKGLIQAIGRINKRILRRKGNPQASGIKEVNHQGRTPRVIHLAKSTERLTQESAELETQLYVINVTRMDIKLSNTPTHLTMGML